MFGHSSAFIFDWISFIFAGIDAMHLSLNEFEFWPYPPLTMEFAALERLKIDDSTFPDCYQSDNL